MLFILAPSIFATRVQSKLPILLVNPALLNSTALSSVGTDVLNVQPCFEPKPDRLPARYQDCESAAMKMHSVADTRRYIFGRGSFATYKLPRTFSHGTCVVNLDMVYEEETDILTFVEVRSAVLLLARSCTLGPVFHVGGVAAVGPANALFVTIFGSVSRAPASSAAVD